MEKFLIDTHAHLYVRQFKNDVEAVLERAHTEGIKKIYLPAIDSETHQDMLDLEAAHPNYCIAMMGVHPCSINAETIDNELVIAEKYLSDRPFCAVGEIGIDLYWDKTTLPQQKDAFIRQMHWAQDLKIPLVIHSRESTDVIIEILRDNSWYTEGGIFHCFTGNVEQAKAIIDKGFYLGIGGVLTYKNGGLEPVIKEIPLENMVLETDAPYLAPMPFRGKRNESSYIKYIAQRISEIKIVDYKEVATHTTANAEKIFSKQGQMVLN
jgi:TatD DNase family protein